MDLKDFVSESIKQVLDGVIEAQKYAHDKDAFINPTLLHYTNPGSDNLAILSSRGTPNKPVQIMEFDIAVTSTETGEIKAGIGIFAGPVGIGTQVKSDDESMLANRIKFSLPILFPQQHYTEK